MARSSRATEIRGTRPVKKPTGYKAVKLDALFDQAIQAQLRGQLTQAEGYYRKILKGFPAHPDANQLLGVICHQTGRFGDAIQHLRCAVALSPGVHFYHLNLGRAYKDSGDYVNARASITTSIELNPDVAQAHCLLASVCLDLKEYGVGLSAVERGLAIQPEDPIALNTQGLLLQRLDRGQDALRCFERAIALQPDYGIACNNLGNLSRKLGLTVQARQYLERAAGLMPRNTEVHLNLGHLLTQQRSYSAAAGAYHRAIDLVGMKNCPADWFVLEATALYLGGEVEQAVACCDGALQLNPGHRGSWSYRLLLSCYQEPSSQQLATRHHQWGAAQTQRSAAPELPTRAGRIRIGYVSPDFKEHSVAYFLKPILAHHDRDRFEVFCYSEVEGADTTTEWFKEQADHWREIRGLSAEQAAAAVAKDHLHLLIDLAGHTPGNRLELFCQRPAPVQATYLGYPNTTGLGCIDYRISDHYADPVGTTEAQYTEQLVRLPQAFFTYQPPLCAPPVGALPALRNGYITFGSFNNLAKVCDRTIRVWSGILQRIPDAKLLMQTSALKDQSVRDRVLARFEQVGINPTRLMLYDLMSFDDHLALHNQVDIVLDTLLWNGHTTTCNSLWMGLPHLVRVGDRHASRMGWSILSNLGLQDWAAETDVEYIELAVNKSKELTSLALLRAELRSRMQSSGLVDAANFTRSLEQSIVTMLARHSGP